MKKFSVDKLSHFTGVKGHLPPSQRFNLFVGHCVARLE